MALGNGPAKISAKLIAMERPLLGRGSGKTVRPSIGIERRIAQVVECFPVECIAATLSNQSDDSGPGAFILSVVHISHDLLLLHGIVARGYQEPSPIHRGRRSAINRSEEHTSELQSRRDLVC